MAGSVGMLGDETQERPRIWDLIQHVESELSEKLPEGSTLRLQPVQHTVYGC
jgi:hypothetical protein